MLNVSMRFVAASFGIVFCRCRVLLQCARLSFKRALVEARRLMPSFGDDSCLANLLNALFVLLKNIDNFQHAYKRLMQLNALAFFTLSSHASQSLAMSRETAPKLASRTRRRMSG